MIRLTRFEIVLGAKKSDRERGWLALSDVTRQMRNRIWRYWLTWHVQRNHDLVLRQWWAELITATRERGKKPKCPVQALTKELSNEIYHDCSKLFTNLNARTRVLLQNIICRDIGKKGDVDGKMKAWQAVLMDRQERPASMKRNPIPFDKENSKLIPPEKTGEDFGLVLRIERTEETGKSVVDTVRLMSRGRKVISQVKILWKIVTGEWKFCGSSVIYDENRRKWYAMISYEIPRATEEFAGTGSLIVRASRFGQRQRYPWLLIAVNDGKITARRPCGYIDHVAAVRRQLVTQRWSRQHRYRNAGSADKGHGRRRAITAVFKLSLRWKNYVKTMNQNMAKRIVDIAIEHGCGTIVYWQPVNDYRLSRSLSMAGKVSRHESTLWDWYQVGTCLNNECEERGLKCVVEKHGKTVPENMKAVV